LLAVALRARTLTAADAHASYEILGRGESAALDGTRGTGLLVAGATWDVLALLAAIGLSVSKPGRALRRRIPAASGTAVSGAQ
jgi:hypothetical protein